MVKQHGRKSKRRRWSKKKRRRKGMMRRRRSGRGGCFFSLRCTPFSAHFLLRELSANTNVVDVAWKENTC